MSWKYYVLMYENGNMRHYSRNAGIIPGMGGGENKGE
jgi:hypothetical protein